MNLSSQIHSLFTIESMIRLEMNIEKYISQNEYLITGELLIWNGPKQEVFSPVFIQGVNNENKNQFT